MRIVLNVLNKGSGTKSSDTGKSRTVNVDVEDW